MSLHFCVSFLCTISKGTSDPCDLSREAKPPRIQDFPHSLLITLLLGQNPRHSRGPYCFPLVPVPARDSPTSRPRPESPCQRSATGFGTRVKLLKSSGPLASSPQDADCGRGCDRGVWGEDTFSPLPLPTDSAFRLAWQGGKAWIPPATRPGLYRGPAFALLTQERPRLPFLHFLFFVTWNP